MRLLSLPVVVLAFSILSLAAPQVAEAGCTKSETDAFSGEVRDVVSGAVLDFNDGYVHYKLSRASGQTQLTLDLVQLGAVDMPLTPEQPVKIKLDSGTLLDLTPVGVVAPEVDSYGSSLYTRWRTTFQVTDQQLLDLANAKLVAVMIPLPTGPRQWEIDKPLRKAMFKAASCMTK